MERLCGADMLPKEPVVLHRLYQLRFSLSERWNDFRHGIKTNGQLFHLNPEHIEYTPFGLPALGFDSSPVTNWIG